MLAAEAFGNNPEGPGGPTPAERLAQDGFVRRSTGMYTLDPVFANDVRNALTLGYRPIGYEQTSSQRTPEGGVPEREQAQADNLMAYLRAHPTAKRLIHVGHGHVLQGGATKPEYAMMAQRLKQMSGIDPLTIDQTTLSELAANARPALRVAQSRMNGKAAVFLEHDQPLILGRVADRVDLQVIHPARRYAQGRPAWLASLGGAAMRHSARLAAQTGHPPDPGLRRRRTRGCRTVGPGAGHSGQAGAGADGAGRAGPLRHAGRRWPCGTVV